MLLRILRIPTRERTHVSGQDPAAAVGRPGQGGRSGELTLRPDLGGS